MPRLIFLTSRWLMANTKIINKGNKEKKNIEVYNRVLEKSGPR